MATQKKGTGFDPETMGAPRGKNNLLVIAIDEYVHCSELHNCVKDAREFIEVLSSKYQFEPDNITTLYNSEATRPNIHTQLRKLKSEVGLDDNLIIYFSGHGVTADNVGYWVPVNAHLGNEWEYFSTDEIKRRLDVIDCFHTLVIVDACFSGSLFLSYRSAESIPLGYEAKRSRWGLAASHSREQALDGTPGENSPFAKTLLRYLKNSQEHLPIQSLAGAIIERVEEMTKGRQTPVFKPLDVKGDDSGQYVFRLKANEAADWKVCQEKRTLIAYQSFLKKYPEGAHAQEAREQITFLQEEEAWKTARNKKDINDYIQYRRDYPNGRYREQALEMIHELEEDQDWQKADQLNSVFAYETYLGKYPNGRYRQEAEVLLQAILSKQQEQKDEETPGGHTWIKPLLIGLGILAVSVIIVWSVSYLRNAGPIGSSTESLSTDTTEISQTKVSNSTTPGKDSILPPVKKQIIPLQASRNWLGGDKLEITISNGTPPYTILLNRKDKEVYCTELSIPGKDTILLEEFLKDPGAYELRVEDSTAQPISKFIVIGVRLGSRTYKTIELDSLTWLAENLDYESANSWYYKELQPLEKREYGRLYTWEAAKQACKKLGSEWRLPTDQEWKSMVEQFGDAHDNAADIRSVAYKALIKNGSSGFTALLGGHRNTSGKFVDHGSIGYYWSSTEHRDRENYAWRYEFYGSSRLLDRDHGNKVQGYSCRCVMSVRDDSTK